MGLGNIVMGTGNFHRIFLYRMQLILMKLNVFTISIIIKSLEKASVELTVTRYSTLKMGSILRGSYIPEPLKLVLLTLGVGVCTSTECLLRKGYFLLCRFSRQ
jgi:hypothetical protein